ncbi:hypothetical protein F2Q69_00058453 [Brassica cretica]|uniref:Uncharacterized protein n=1 Tax=Brassica cretica TaxID=69181 RepID=A0A8S9RK84_BRACR|nr:hypothetical protein F2Q69_00058453 [Brassica cretica]
MGTLHPERLTSRRSGTQRFESLQRSSQTSCSLKISSRRSPTGRCKPCTLVLRMKSELLGPTFQFKRTEAVACLHRSSSISAFGKYSVNKEVQYLDIKYLMACHIMRDEETYNFFDKADVEDITPEAEPSYDLGELADVTDDQAYRRWMVDSQRKNNNLMRRIPHLITGGCIGGSNQRQPPAEQTPRSHRPGKAPMGTCTSTEEVHRSRNRRSFDPAESGEYD